MTNNTLQVTNFNFYGDELIAIKDNSTGEIYTAINHILRGIGFNEIQIRKRRDKWIDDLVIAKGIQKLKIPYIYDNKLETDQKRSPLEEYDMYCISNRKLPLALAKINITPKMKRTQPELAEKLELYQDKCADVLASVFLDHNTNDQIALKQIFDNFSTLTNSVIATIEQLNNRVSTLEEKSSSNLPQPQKQIYNPWFSKMNNKYQLLQDYFNITRGQLYRNILLELENLYDLNTTQIQADYLYENNLTSCYPLDPYSFVPKYRDMIEKIVNDNLIKYEIASEDDPITSTKHITIFDTPVNNSKYTS